MKYRVSITFDISQEWNYKVDGYLAFHGENKIRVFKRFGISCESTKKESEFLVFLVKNSTAVWAKGWYFVGIKL